MMRTIIYLLLFCIAIFSENLHGQQAIINFSISKNITDLKWKLYQNKWDDTISNTNQSKSFYFGNASQLHKYVYFKSEIAFNHYINNFHVTNKLSSNSNEYSFVYGSLENIGVSMIFAPEIRFKNKYVHCFVNSGIQLKQDVLNHLIEGTGLDASGSLDDLSKFNSKRNFSTIWVNTLGASVYYHGIGLSLELGFSIAPSSVFIDDVLSYRSNAHFYKLGISYLIKK
ncbi:MAG: hypothetical protein IPK88_02300 [Saprospiraceae bacterium]|nr:hypothetical protein [Candidatus Defluviibacterium haderslevense]